MARRVKHASASRIKVGTVEPGRGAARPTAVVRRTATRVIGVRRKRDVGDVDGPETAVYHPANDRGGMRP